MSKQSEGDVAKDLLLRIYSKNFESNSDDVNKW